MEELFFKAIENGNDDTVERHVENDAKIVNIKRVYDDNTPLHIAVTSESNSLVEYLLSHGADIDAKNSKGWTPLHLAAMYESENIVFYLLSAGADITIKNSDGKTPQDIMKENLIRKINK